MCVVASGIDKDASIGMTVHLNQSIETIFGNRDL
jgi:hypothetical protein